MHYVRRGTVGEWTFYEVADHGFSGSIKDQPLYGFTVTAEEKRDHNIAPRIGEMYGSLDHAMVAAIAEKHTGPRGAGGTGVGTAADWFMKMIGAGQLQDAGAEGRSALTEAIGWTERTSPMGKTVEIVSHLEAKGYVIARNPL